MAYHCMCLSTSRSVVDFAQHHCISDFYLCFLTLTYLFPPACLPSVLAKILTLLSPLQTQGAAPLRRGGGWGAQQEL